MLMLPFKEFQLLKIYKIFLEIMYFSSNSDTFEITAVLPKNIIITALTFVSPYYCKSDDSQQYGTNKNTNPGCYLLDQGP